VTTTFTPEEMAKLPKWAREKVESIQRQRDGAINLATVRAGEPTGIKLGYAHGDDVQVYIPDDGRGIKFSCPTKHDRDGFVEVNRCVDGIRVSSNSTIAVEPCASNVVNVVCAEWVRR